jgi:hypothetical protein
MSRASSTARGSSFAFDEDDLALEAALEESMCYACGHLDTRANLPASHDGNNFHDKCYLGVRAHNRSLADFPHARAVNTQNYKFKPDLWRQAVAPFLPMAAPDVRATALSAAKRKHREFEQHVTKETDELLEDDMLVTLDQYIGWKKMHEASTKSHNTLEKEFSDLLAAQGSVFQRKDGADRVKIPGLGRVRAGKGTEILRGVKQTTACDVETYSSRRRRLYGKTPGNSPAPSPGDQRGDDAGFSPRVGGAAFHDCERGGGAATRAQDSTPSKGKPQKNLRNQTRPRSVRYPPMSRSLPRRRISSRRWSSCEGKLFSRPSVMRLCTRTLGRMA